MNDETRVNAVLCAHRTMKNGKGLDDDEGRVGLAGIDDDGRRGGGANHGDDLGRNYQHGPGFHRNLGGWQLAHLGFGQ